MSRTRALVVTAAAITVAACSSSSNQRPVAGEPSRDLQLAEPAVSEAVQVSDLEAGRSLTAGTTRRATTRTPKPQATPESVIAVEQPTVAETTKPVSEVVEAPMATASAPAPKEEDVVVLVGRGAEPMYTSNLDHGFGGGSGRRDPTIIIRGGRGGIDDDCDLDRPGHGPVAVNRVGGPVGGITLGGRSRVSLPRGIR